MPHSLLEDDATWVEHYRDAATDDDPAYVSKQYVTKEQLAEVWECNPTLITSVEVEELNACLERFDITTPKRIRHFLSQTAHESGGGRYKCPEGQASLNTSRSAN